MLFTWDTTNLCLVFKWWQIRGPFSLIVSLLAVVALGAGYELIRELSRRYDSQTDSIALGSRGMLFTCLPSFASAAIMLYATVAEIIFFSSDDISNDRSSLLHSEAGNNNGSNARNTRMIKALLYAVQVFYSFFIM